MEPLSGVEIPLSKKKLILLLFGALLLTAIGCWFVASPDKFSRPFGGNNFPVMAAGAAAMLFFGTAAYLLFKKLPDHKPGLIIDQTGILDYSSSNTPVPVLWADIEDLWVLRIQNRKLIMIQVRNPEHYIAQEKNSLKRRLMKVNHRMYGTPVSITANRLKISFEKLWGLLAEKFKEAHGME